VSQSSQRCPAPVVRMFCIHGRVIAWAMWSSKSCLWMYLIRPEHWEHVGRAHGEVFAENSPDATMVVVAGCSTHACLLRSKPSPIAVYDYRRPPRCACGSVHETPADSRFCAGLWRTPRTEADDDKYGHRTTRGP